MELNIKNMVCGRCLKVVREVMNKNELNVSSIELGKVNIENDLSDSQLLKIRQDLQSEGFDLVDDQKAMLVQSIKNLIIEQVHYGELDEMKENFSRYLSSKLHRDYNYLSNLFSSTQNITIEHFILLQKVEKIKELLVYDEKSVSEIAYSLGYSSPAHLSNQFKKMTGFSPSEFKRLKDHHRNPLDEV